MLKKFLPFLFCGLLMVGANAVHAQRVGEPITYIEYSSGEPEPMLCYLPAGTINCYGARHISWEEYHAYKQGQFVNSQDQYRGRYDYSEEQRDSYRNNSYSDTRKKSANRNERREQQDRSNEVYQIQEETYNNLDWQVFYNRNGWYPSGGVVSGSRGNRKITVRSNSQTWQPEIRIDSYGRQFYYRDGYRHYLSY